MPFIVPDPQEPGEPGGGGGPSPLVLELGGTEADLSATGPGVVIQASAGAPLSIATTGDEGDVLTLVSDVPTWEAPAGGSSVGDWLWIAVSLRI